MAQDRARAEVFVSESPEVAEIAGKSVPIQLYQGKIEENIENYKSYFPKFEYTTDNAAMIGIVGYYNYIENNFSNASVVSKARIEF